MSATHLISLAKTSKFRHNKLTTQLPTG